MLERLANTEVFSRTRQKIAKVGFNNFRRLEKQDDIRIAIQPPWCGGAGADD